MHNIRNIILYAAAALALSACNIVINSGSGSVSVRGRSENGIDTSEERFSEPFRAVVSSIPCNVYYSTSGTYSVLVEGKSEFVPKVKTEVSDGVLRIGLEKGRYENLVLRVTVKSPVVSKLATTGSGDIICRGEIVTPDPLSIKVSGSGSIEAETVKSSKLMISTSGSGDIDINKAVGATLYVNTSGSGDICIDLADIDSEVNVVTSGSGDCSIKKINVFGKLGMQSSGSGDITVDGLVTEIVAKCSGSGDIISNLAYDKIISKETGSGKIHITKRFE